MIIVGGMKRAKSSTQTFSGALLYRGRIVDDQSLALDPLEQMGRGGDVAKVEWRILPHHYHIDVAAEVEDRELAEPEMVAGGRLDRKSRGHQRIAGPPGR